MLAAATPGRLARLRADVLKEKAERSLYEFGKQAWAVVEPTTPFLDNWHHRAICDHLEAVTRGELTRLVINMPPRYGKSFWCSIAWPDWEWLRHPGERWTFCSYSASLSSDHSVARRLVIQSDWYRGNWGDRFYLVGDQNLKTEFRNSHRGVMLATSVGGSATGKGGNRIVCLASGTPVMTDLGELPIGDVVGRKLAVRVLAFDHCTNATRWRRIEAYESSPGRPSVRVTFSDGRSMEATEDHPIYAVGRGYVPADQLRPGDEVIALDRHLRPLRQDVRSRPEAPGAGSREERAVLRPGLLRRLLCGRGQPRLVRGPRLRRVRGLRQDVLLQAMPREEGQGSVLLDGLPGGGLPQESASLSRPIRAVLGLREGHQDYAAHGRQVPVLHPRLRRCRPRPARLGPRERSVCPWQVRRALSALVPQAGPADPRAGRTSLRALPPHRRGPGIRAARPPYRLRQGEQQPGEPHHGLQVVPRLDARRQPEPRQLAPLIVDSIRPVPAPDRVYNVRVEGDHNYFAAGVLVHNCDDVHNPEQAESDTERGRAIRFFDSTLYSRLNDKALGAFVIVMQRLHEDDLAGHLERQGGWTILRLEGRAEHDRVVTTPAGRTFRRELGEPLWPEREDAAKLDEAERVMSPYVFAGQYQQRPAPAGGGMIKAERLQVVESLPALTRHVRYWDKAGTAGGGKRTAGVLMALGVDRKFYILDVVKGQWSAGRREEVMLQTARLDGPAVTTWHEQEPGSGGKESAENTNMNLAGFDVHAERVTGNKADRARPFAAQVEAGNVLLYRRPGLPPEQDWTRDFIGEARLFPNGRFLDQIDGAGGAFNKIALAPLPGRAAAGGKVEGPKGVL